MPLSVIQPFIPVPTIVKEVTETDKRSVLFLDKCSSWTPEKTHNVLYGQHKSPCSKCENRLITELQ